MSTKAYTLSARDAASNLAARYASTKDKVKGNASPSVKDNLLSRMNIDNDNDTSQGERLIIDVQPDFRPVLMALIYYAVIWYKQIEQKDHSKISPPNLVLYFFSLIYGYFFLSDYHIRQPMSPHAAKFWTNPRNREFINFLANQPVPDFLVKFFTAWTPASDPRRPGMDFTPTFAAFSYHHDWPYIFPLHIFAHCHNVAASVKTQGEPLEIMYGNIMNWNYIAGTWTVAIGNLFGQLMPSNGTAGSTDCLQNKFIQAFVSMINPAIYRAQSNRTAYSRTPMFAPELTDTRFNIYDFLFGGEDNLSEIQTIIESVSASVSDVFKFSGVLGSQFENQSGLDILRHGYSIYELPTWHYAAIRQVSTSGTAVSARDRSTKQYAAEMIFLAAPTYTKSADLNYPTEADQITDPLYLVENVNRDADTAHPAAADYITFKAKEHDYPRVRIFDAYDYNPSTFSTPIYAGLVIRTFEISGFSVPQPHLNSHLDEENSQILQSAVPMTHIRRSTQNRANPTYVLRVHETMSDRQSVFVNLYAMFENWLPNFAKESGDPVPAALPGFDVKAQTSWFRRAYNTLSYRIRTPENQTSDESTPPASEGSIVAWSPYRFVAHAKPSKHTAKLYMLLNFRTIYGTNVTLAEVKHFQESIPIA